MTKLLIAASGTGGHLFPAIAVAESLPDNWHISWLGVPNRLETKLVPSQFDLVTVQGGGLQGSAIHKLLQLWKLLAATRQTLRLMHQRKIQLVFTTGGYIAAPAILGALCCRVPVVIHESNAFPGRVTRLLGRFCKVVALGLPSAAQNIKAKTIVVTGTPVRPSFLVKQSIPSWVPSSNGPLIIVMGGSQGAIGLNNMVRALLPSVLQAGCRVVHLTGANDKGFNQFHHPNLVEKKFTNEIPALLQHADLAISRAGSGSLSELAVCGTPSILIPYPFAANNHQEANALCAASIGAAVIVHEHEPNQNILTDTLWRLISPKMSGCTAEHDPLLKMRRAMKKLASPEAKKHLIDLLQQIK